MKRPRSRSPKKDEIEVLINHVLKQYENPDEDDRNEVAGQVRQAGISVIDNYITDGPGYAGRIMFVVWSGAPEIHEVLLLSAKDGIPRSVVQDPGFSNRHPIPRDYDEVILLDGQRAEIVGARVTRVEDSWWQVTVMLHDMSRREVRIEWDYYGEESSMWREVQR
jgi:hypothetical protein